MLNIEIYVTSHRGRVRPKNEDNYLLLNVADSETLMSSQNVSEFVIESRKFEIGIDGVLLAVSDGVGGAPAGEEASRMAVETVCRICLVKASEQDILSAESKDFLGNRLYNAAVDANDLIFRQGHSDLQRNAMAATFTGAGITPEKINLIQVGDSRGYLIRNAKIS